MRLRDASRIGVVVCFVLADWSSAAGTGDSLLLVFYRPFSFAPNVEDLADESRVVECVGDALRRARPGQRLVPFEAFREAAFPHLDPLSVPRSPEHFAVLAGNAGFRARIRPLGIRHVAFVGGVTESVAEGEIVCAGGYGGAGCFGMITWDEASRIGATVLDLDGGPTTREVDASASGRSWLAVIGLVPLGGDADTVGTACTALGERLAATLAGGRSERR